MLKKLLILLIAVMTTSAFAQWSTPVQCPYDGNYYSLRNRADQWNDAKNVAHDSSIIVNAAGVIVPSGQIGRKVNGNLAKITSTLVRDWIIAHYYTLNPGYVLIGGYRGSSPTGWLWEKDSSTMAVNSTFWKVGEPNNFQGRENVAAINFGNGGYFEDVSSNGTYYYLVQYVVK